MVGKTTFWFNAYTLALSAAIVWALQTVWNRKIAPISGLKRITFWRTLFFLLAAQLVAQISWLIWVTN